MKTCKIAGLLLLAAFIALMGFNEHAFADSKLNVKKLFDTLDAIKAQIQTHDSGVSTDHTDLLTKLNEIQALINTNHDILEDIDAATSESCPDSWKKVLPDNERFEVVMGGAAVLDKETCLVWEKSPSTTTMTWFAAIYHCYDMNLGGRGGWRLPTVEELRSLIDPTQSNPALPVGHPFLNVQSDWYWSATTDANDTSNAWGVDFGDGGVGSGGKSGILYVWCVRGGHGHDAY